MKYQIWSNVSYRNKLDRDYVQFMDGYRPEAPMLMSHEDEAPMVLVADPAMRAPMLEALLESIFALFNVDERPNGKIVHSLSVGDVVKVGDEAYAVKTLGWEKLDKFEPVLAGA